MVAAEQNIPRSDCVITIPSSADALHTFECLRQRIFQWYLRIIVQQSQTSRLLLMFNIDTLVICRRTSANAFVLRLTSILNEYHATERQKLQAKKIQMALNTSGAFHFVLPLVLKPLTKDQIISIKQTMRERISGNMRRPVPSWKRFLPALHLKSMKRRALTR